MAVVRGLPCYGMRVTQTTVPVATWPSLGTRSPRVCDGEVTAPATSRQEKNSCLGQKASLSYFASEATSTTNITEQSLIPPREESSSPRSYIYERIHHPQPLRFIV